MRSSIGAGSESCESPSPSENAPSSIGSAAGGTSMVWPFTLPADSSASSRFTSADDRRRYAPSPNGTNSPLRSRNAFMSSAMEHRLPSSSWKSPETENQKSRPPTAESLNPPGFGATTESLRPLRHSRRTAPPSPFSAIAAATAYSVQP